MLMKSEILFKDKKTIKNIAKSKDNKIIYILPEIKYEKIVLANGEIVETWA